MRTFKSKLGGFFPRVGADVAQLAAKTRHDLLARPDVQKLREVLWKPNQQTQHVNEWNQIVPSPVDQTSVFDMLAALLANLPDEGFKLFPWVVREFKKGALASANSRYPQEGITWVNLRHSQDIIEQGIRWLVWSREHNRPAPDMMSKQFGIQNLEDWVYEMNAQNTQEEWSDSVPVFTLSDGWQVVKVGPEDVGKEGEIMGHCVGGYIAEARDGKIYSLRDPKGEPHVTVELSGDPTDSQSLRNGFNRVDILQQQGKSNQRPISEYQNRLEEWYTHLNQQGWDVENKEDREPEYDYREHYMGPLHLDEPDDVIDYHRAMTDRWDRDDWFADDEDPEFNENDNTYYYQLPREIVPTGNGGLPALASQFAQEVLKGERDDIDQFVQGLWIALRHIRQRDDWQNPDAWKGAWQQCIDAVQKVIDQYQTPPAKTPKQPTLFTPEEFGGQRQAPLSLQAMVRYMQELKNAPDQYEEPYEKNVAGEDGRLLRDESGNYVTEPAIRTRRFTLPGDGNYNLTDLNTYFNHIGMPGISMKGTFARYIKTANLVEKLVKLAAGQGQDFTQFFTDATQGEYAPHVMPNWKFQNPEHQTFHDTAQTYAGNFDTHIETSIPDYRGVQVRKGVALSKAFPGAHILDIGGSEGSWAKTMALNGVQATVLDPNRAMHDFFQQTSVPGASYAPDSFGPGFTDDDGTVYPQHTAYGQYDIVNESMTFQFISPDRESQIAEAKRMLKPGGLLILDEKLLNDNWQQNEATKDQWKQQFFTPEDLQRKNEVVRFANAVGMVSNMVHVNDLEGVLRKNFAYVQRYWESGNFMGYLASDNQQMIQRFLAVYDHSDVPDPQVGGPKLAARDPNKVYDVPFLYDPDAPEGPWLRWGQPNRTHEMIYDSLARQGERATGNQLHGRYFPDEDRVHIYHPAWRVMPDAYREKHEALIRRNSPVAPPVRPQEAPGGDEMDSWTRGPDSPVEDDWRPVMGL